MPLSLFHLHGDLQDLRFPRLLAALREDDFTGVFQATTSARSPAPDSASAQGAAHDAAETTREVHFSNGHIAWAISTDREESLRAYLLRHRAITEAQWAEAEERAREGVLRDALVERGLINARELMQIERGRAEEIVLALFSARNGEYRVRERQLSPATPDLQIDPRGLILKGVLERGDRALILDEVGSLSTVYVVKRPALDQAGAGLPGEFQSVLKHIDGKRSIAQICAITSLPDYFVCSVLAALSMIGAVRRNYEKMSGKGRGEIVKGIEVAPASRAEAATPDNAIAPESGTITSAPPSALASPTAERASDPPPPVAPKAPPPRPSPAGSQPPRTPAPVRLPARTPETASPPLPPLPPHPMTPPRPSVRPVAASPPGGLPPPSRGAMPATPGMPDVKGMPEEEAPLDSGSRPWLLLGGAAAVGVIVLFLILFSQNPGGAGPTIRPVAEAALQPEDASALSGRPATATGKADNRNDPDDGNMRTTGPSQNPAGAAAPPAVATRRAESILAPEPGQTSRRRPNGVAGGTAGAGIESLVSGDYRSAARQFGREVSSASGGFTIQLLTACQEETVRRAVESAGGSSSLFILSTTLEGRSCYRVYWGRYPSQTRAREAMRHEVPAVFLEDQNQPRIVRLGGS